MPAVIPENFSKSKKAIMENINLSIMGVEYLVIYDKSFSNQVCCDEVSFCSGYIDNVQKEIHILDETQSDDASARKAAVEGMKVTLRHEIIHAFLYESGLWCDSYHAEFGWAMNEEMVDWMAIQFEKIADVFKKAGCL